jgi:hypothetical protein
LGNYFEILTEEVLIVLPRVQDEYHVDLSMPKSIERIKNLGNMVLECTHAEGEKQTPFPQAMKEVTEGNLDLASDYGKAVRGALRKIFSARSVTSKKTKAMARKAALTAWLTRMPVGDPNLETWRIRKLQKELDKRAHDANEDIAPPDDCQQIILTNDVVIPECLGFLRG